MCLCAHNAQKSVSSNMFPVDKYSVFYDCVCVCVCVRIYVGAFKAPKGLSHVASPIFPGGDYRFLCVFV